MTTDQSLSQRRRLRDTSTASGVSLAFTLDTTPNRVAAFRAVMTALLHAGCSFGHAQPGHVVASYDMQGEHYAAPVVVPAGANPTLPQALELLTSVEANYNRTIGFGLTTDQVSLPLTCRLYDEKRVLTVRLDLGPPGWAQLVRARRSRRAATTTLLDTGRTIFTLLGIEYLLLGPATILQHLVREPELPLLRRTPVVLLAAGHPRVQPLVPRVISGALEVEDVPRGKVVVRAWDASTTVVQDTAARISRRA